jgi:hypothetical protein
LRSKADLKRSPFDSGLLVGAAYGSVYEVTGNGKTLTLVPSGELLQSFAAEIGACDVGRSGWGLV